MHSFIGMEASKKQNDSNLSKIITMNQWKIKTKALTDMSDSRDCQLIPLLLFYLIILNPLTFLISFLRPLPQLSK